MKVKQLVEYLNKCDENMEVVIKSEEEDTILIPVFDKDANKITLVSGNAKKDVSEIIKRLFALSDEVFIDDDFEYHIVNKLLRYGITPNNIGKYLGKEYIDRMEKICKSYNLEY